MEDNVITVTGPSDAVQNHLMIRFKPDSRKHTVKPGGEGWLVSEQQQLVFHCMADTPSVHVEWFAVRAYSWVSPRPPVPQAQRRMLRHNTVEAWQTILKTG